MHLIDIFSANELMKTRHEDLENQKKSYQQQLEQLETDHNRRMQVFCFCVLQLWIGVNALLQTENCCYAVGKFIETRYVTNPNELLTRGHWAQTEHFVTLLWS